MKASLVKARCPAETLCTLAGTEAIPEEKRGSARPVINIVGNAAFIRASIAPVGLINTSGGADTPAQEQSPIPCSRPNANKVTPVALARPVWPDPHICNSSAAGSSPAKLELVYPLLSLVLELLSHHSYMCSLCSELISSVTYCRPTYLFASKPVQHTARMS